MRITWSSISCSSAHKLREIVAELDHYVLLPTQHPQIHVDDDGREVTATFGDQRWVFPSGDCRLLPVANTTAELLAAYIGERLVAALAADASELGSVRVEVDECDGQIAVWERQFGNDGTRKCSSFEEPTDDLLFKGARPRPAPSLSDGRGRRRSNFESPTKFA